MEAVGKHMRDKWHCKANFEKREGVLELAQFYEPTNNGFEGGELGHGVADDAFMNSDNLELVCPKPYTLNPP